MSIGELLLSAAVVGWFLGIGLLAHAIPKWLEDNDFTQMVMVLEPERLSVLMALFVVAWPVAIPVAALMQSKRKN
jgi:hypothetical protein